MADFDYAKFARCYLGRWTDRAVEAGLTRIYQQGFDYEDNVNLPYKDLLLNILFVTRVGSSTFEVEFGDVDIKLNSDCLAAVEDYLRVFFCERGYVTSYEESVNLLGYLATNFSGLLPPGVKPEDRYKGLFISLHEGSERLELLMEDAQQAFEGLMKEIARRQASTITNPSISGEDRQQARG